ncbi:MAG: HEPN domain-containing protein [Caldilineaceae bacterium SB0675_bin_29]|uniref:HEPN domain-containing protein n=1 Tax=Caldilineaceae bacterium SB0675_bin_29 TaxID=2605266 RepID=A0A6B1G6T1_9CHLR|nr:HEPN domain-containing protein [Caldilineaceae bacterium SB0675_bin_29]
MQPDGCWHSQQAAERALKAALVLEGIDFPFTHDLNALRNLLPDSWPVRADLAELTGWAVQARYPGEWPEPSVADAIRAESEARAVHNAVEAEFRCRGLYAGLK